MKFNFATAIARKSVVAVLLLAWASPLATVRAQQSSLQADANREEVRRQQDVIIAQQLVVKADKAAAEKDYESAYVNYLDALDKIPAGGVTAGLHAEVLAKFSSTGIQYAEVLVNDGHYGDAERVAKTILLPQYNPTCKPAVQFLSNLEQSDYYNKTVTPGFAADRDKVTKLLLEADGYFQSGRFDLAMKRYEQVLSIDRYNIAARKGMEQVTKEKTTYYNNAYNETRSRMLWMVDAKWDRPVRRFDNVRSTTQEVVNRGVHGNEQIIAKLNRIIIPKIDLRDTTVREAVEFLKQQSKQLDNSTDDNKLKRGVNIVLKLDNTTPAPDPTAAPPVAPAPGPDGTPPVAAAPVSGNADTSVTLALTNVPLIEALRYLTELAHLKYKIEPYAVSIVPLGENTTDLVTKEYRVPPGFIPTSTPDASGATAAPGGNSITATKSNVGQKVSALEFLRDTGGVAFPPGGFAQYIPAGSRLIVRNTPDAIDLIDSLVDAASSAQPTQVEIESKFLEITQNNLKELGFNWLLGPLQIGGGTYGAGGTQGFGTNADPTSPNPANYPFNAGGIPVGQNPVTSGLRSGAGLGPGAGISANSIDALLGTVATGAAPAIFGVSGIFTNPQFQVVIRALNQKKGIDLMTAPKVTTKSGRKALVRVAREFPYPTEFNPPQPPPAATGGGSSGTVIVAAGSLVSQGVVTPSTPTAFETRNLGVTLEVEPIIGPDNYTIDLNLSPEVVEFDGFINYGSPILGPIFIFPATIGTAVLTSNVINQPIFSTRKVTTSVSIWDGQTVALGGLVREDVQKVQDKVPLLGDIPIAGRLFRSDIDQKIKRNLIIFVTARLMDAEGRPVRQDEDIEEVVEPLGLPQDLPGPTINQATFSK
ncbi:hypothetical protein BH09VER1_BH09VER1_11440 [soil metagenome]